MAHPRRRAGSLEIPSDRVGPRNPAQRAYTAKEEINEDILAQFESFLYDTDAATAGIAAAPSGSTVPLPEGLPYPGFPPLQDPPAFPSRDSGLFSSPKGAPPPTSLPWHLAAHLARFGGVGARDRELFAPGGGRDSGGASGLGSGRGGMMRGPVGGGTAADVAMLEAGTGRLSLQTPDDAPRGGATLSTAELLGVRGAARAGMPSELFMRGSDIASMRTSDAPGRRGLDEGLDLLRAAGSEDVPLGMSDPLEGIEDPRVWGATEKRGSGSRAPSGKQGPEELEVHSEEEQRRMRDAAQQYLEALGRIGSDKARPAARSGSARSHPDEARSGPTLLVHPAVPPLDDASFNRLTACRALTTCF